MSTIDSIFIWLFIFMSFSNQHYKIMKTLPKLDLPTLRHSSIEERTQRNKLIII